MLSRIAIRQGRSTAYLSRVNFLTMASSSSSSIGKRKKADVATSPPSAPPLKKQVTSGTTKSAIASFFTPTSQKPSPRTTWNERGTIDDTPPTLLVGRYQPEGSNDQPDPSRTKVAAFDLDSTLITTASGKRHADDASDWKWWHSSVPGRLRSLYHDEGYRVVILSNQAGLTLHADPKAKGPKKPPQGRVNAFKLKCNAVLTNLDIPTTVYAATGKDIFRKPRPGMWTELCDDYDLTDVVDLEGSVFVGDAGGRVATTSNGQPGAGAGTTAKDFSCSDRNFAANVGIRYVTPEEFFLDEKPRTFAREFDLADYTWSEAQSKAAEIVFEKKDGKEIVLFCGPPGAGKSTFYWKHLKPLGYERINQDTLKSRDKCVKVAKECLQDGISVAIDNTNADPETRAVWVSLAKQQKAPIRCVWFKTPILVCEHNDAVRSMNSKMNPESRTVLPKLAFNGFKSRFKEPQAKEGFEDIIEIDFQFRGTKLEHDIWARYWL